MSEQIADVETEDVVLYGYRNEEGKMLWTPNATFAQIQANNYGTFQVYIEKN